LGQIKQADGAKYHTVTGTRSSTAPALRETTNTENLDYTNALDIWAAGCITYKPRTNRSLFLSAPFRNAIEQRFVDGSCDFSKDSLELSEAGTQLLRLLLAVDPEKRPTALGALRDEWLLSGMLYKSVRHPV
jgi:serine/threonine protein kinase